MRKKRYFCDWVDKHEDRAFAHFWTGYGVVFSICMIVLSKFFLFDVKAADIGGMGVYIIRWLAVIFLNIFITSMIVAIIIYVLCLLFKRSQENKNKDQEGPIIQK